MLEKILIALSDIKLANGLAEKLKLANYTADVLLDGKGVFQKMKVTKPNLVIIDVDLPVVSGYDILNQKNADKDVAKIPTIVVSLSGDPMQMNRIPATPYIKEYVIKFHLEPGELFEKINKFFGRTAPQVLNPNAPKANGKSILWVEDDKLLGTILTKKFENTGYRLLKAVDGRSALELMEISTPDVIVLDIMLPEMSGFDILQKVRGNERLKKVPVLMLSNLSKQSDIDKSKLLGANGFIVKAAVSLDEIIQEVEKLSRKVI